jgi:hypothetical protein
MADVLSISSVQDWDNSRYRHQTFKSNRSGDSQKVPLRSLTERIWNPNGPKGRLLPIKSKCPSIHSSVDFCRGFALVRTFFTKINTWTDWILLIVLGEKCGCSARDIEWIPVKSPFVWNCISPVCFFPLFNLNLFFQLCSMKIAVWFSICYWFSILFGCDSFWFWSLLFILMLWFDLDWMWVLRFLISLSFLQLSFHNILLF